MSNWQEFEGLELITGEYEYEVAKRLLQNELGGVSNGYELSHAQTGNSGWSFGGHQMDISVNQTGMTLLKDIVINHYGESYWTSSLEDSLKIANNPNSISEDIREQIDEALSSDYGKAQINQSFVDSIAEITNHIDKVEEKLQNIDSNLQLSDGAKLMLADYHNQYNLSLNSQVNGSMLKKLQDIVSENGDINIDDIKLLFEDTKYYRDEPQKQGARIEATYNRAKELDEEILNSEQSANNAEEIKTDSLENYINDRKGAKSLLDEMREYLSSKGITDASHTPNMQEMKAEDNSSQNNIRRNN